MTKAQKVEIVSFLTDEFKKANAVVVCDYKGLSVRKLEVLRNRARKDDINVQVVKNTLGLISLKNAGIENLELKDTNLLIWGSDQVCVSKLVTQFAKDSDIFKIKSGYMDGSIVEASQIDAISKLPSKEELIAMLLSVWSAPARNMASVLQAPLRYMVTALDNYKNTKQ